MKIDSTLNELELFKYQIEINEPVKSVTNIFESNNNLPGVILLKKGKFLGIISQRKFWEYMSLPYSKEISSRKSISYIYDFLNIKSLIIPSTTTIVEAARMAIRRPKQEIEEPIVVTIAPQQYRLLKFHTLLVAQSKIHEIANERLMKLYQNIDLAHKKLRLSSSLDCLTQLLNRQVFEKSLKQEWQKAARQWQTHISLIIGGLDCFQSYNEIYGSLSGDDALKEIATVIKKTLRDLNVTMARYSGDRFAIIISERDSIDAAILAEKIRKKILELQISHAGSAVGSYLTMSLGISSSIPSQKSSQKLDDFVIEAERALMNAKQAGKNCTKIWTRSRVSLLFH